jgi:hypothetical protein
VISRWPANDDRCRGFSVEFKEMRSSISGSSASNERNAAISPERMASNNLESIIIGSNYLTTVVLKFLREMVDNKKNLVLVMLLK